MKGQPSLKAVLKLVDVPGTVSTLTAAVQSENSADRDRAGASITAGTPASGATAVGSHATAVTDSTRMAVANRCRLPGIGASWLCIASPGSWWSRQGHRRRSQTTQRHISDASEISFFLVGPHQ